MRNILVHIVFFSCTSHAVESQNHTHLPSLEFDTSFKRDQQKKAIEVDTKPSLNLDPLIRAVLKRNPDLAAVKSRLRAIAITVPRVQELDDPEIRVFGIHQPFNSGNIFIPEARFEIRQKFPFPGKLPLRGEIASWQREVVDKQEIATYRDLIFQTKSLYYQLYFNEKAQLINERNRLITSRFIEVTTALFKTGKGDQKDVLKAQVEQEMLVQELLPLQSEEAAIKAQINALLNRSQSAHIGKPIQQFTPPRHLKFKDLEKLALENRPEIVGLSAMVKGQEAETRLAKLNYWPDFTVFAGLQHSTDAFRDNAWSLGVSFTLPIRINQRQERDWKEALAKTEANIHELEAMKATTRGQIKQILANLKAVWQSIEIYRERLIGKTEKTLDSAQLLYQVGKGDFLFLLDTRRQLQNFELEYVRARINREILYAELERIIGITFEEMADVNESHSLGSLIQDMERKIALEKGAKPLTQHPTVCNICGRSSCRKVRKVPCTREKQIKQSSSSSSL